MTALNTATTATVITVVRSHASQHCENAILALTELSREYLLILDTVDATETRGRDLMRLHRAPMYPLVLVGGEFFSVGRLPRVKCRQQLEALALQGR